TGVVPAHREGGRAEAYVAAGGAAPGERADLRGIISTAIGQNQHGGGVGAEGNGGIVAERTVVVTIGAADVQAGRRAHHQAALVDNGRTGVSVRGGVGQVARAALGDATRAGDHVFNGIILGGIGDQNGTG